jgi:hypothetical protein
MFISSVVKPTKNIYFHICIIIISFSQRINNFNGLIKKSKARIQGTGLIYSESPGFRIFTC